MRHYSFSILFVLFSFFSCSSHAQDVISCREKVYNVMIEAGHLAGPPGAIYPNAVEQDIGGDYDEEHQQLEWNFLNKDKTTTPVVAHCLINKGDKQAVDLSVPKPITRCILAHNQFTCKSGTISYAGYTDWVRFEQITVDGEMRAIDPVTEIRHNKKVLVWKNLDQQRHGQNLSALCYQTVEANATTDKDRRIEIPTDMKECSLMDRRFRCTATPEKHDLFWP